MSVSKPGGHFCAFYIQMAVSNYLQKVSQLLLVLELMVSGNHRVDCSARWAKTSLSGVRFLGYKLVFQKAPASKCALWCMKNSPCLSFSVQMFTALCFVFSERVLFGHNMKLEEGFDHYWRIFDACPVDLGYLYNTNANVCWKSVETPKLSWNDASLACQQDGGHLYISNTESRTALLFDYISQTSRNYSINLSTPASNVYQRVSSVQSLLVGEKTIAFSVKTCSDAHILLSASDSVSDPNVYEIVIGGWTNTQSVIRKARQGPNLKTVSHTVLSCTEWRRFYVRWQNGVIEVGSVTSLSNSVGTTSSFTPFMTYTDSSPTAVEYVFAAGWDKTGQWSFDGVKTFFLGGNDMGTEGSWAWLDGTQVINWFPGQPDNLNNSQNCLESAYLRQVDDAVCTVKNSYICQIPLD